MLQKFKDMVISKISKVDYQPPLCCVLNSMDVYPEGFICLNHLQELYDIFETNETYFKSWTLTT